MGVGAACALREPSLGPVFGAKGGGTGGGQSSLVPAERINLHFTGDIHAVSAAHNLLAALVDNDVYFGAPSRLDWRQIALRRVMDMNDRFLRRIVIGLGGRAMGVPREDGFDITAASEVMAILCLRQRLRRPQSAARPESSSDSAEAARRSGPATCRPKARWRRSSGTPCYRTWCRRPKELRHWCTADLSATSLTGATASSPHACCSGGPRWSSRRQGSASISARRSFSTSSAGRPGSGRTRSSWS